MSGVTEATSGKVLCVCAAEEGVDDLLDRDMDGTGLLDWTAGNSATLSKTTSTPYAGLQALRITYNGTNNPYAYQTVMTVGKRYRVTGQARGDGSAGYPRFSEGTTTKWSGTNSTSWQGFDVTFVATATTYRLYAVATGAGEYADFDSVTLVATPPGYRGGGEPFNGTTDRQGNLLCKSYA